ncbi:hypothetical protein FB567DRAFT_526268 [Paraphoma chrysanthemicola]|uniref:Uncharacterized protein n=1 Tax=Paraphoma chrysanthemicola TaxID=798071 RepID=A0A8K0VYU2_9PLEO|nr:hypothetical protein FB567DRAFT_526268 [Paraphoma chrysanthemicola]
MGRMTPPTGQLRYGISTGRFYSTYCLHQTLCSYSMYFKLPYQHQLMMAASPDQQPWTFDVSSLIVLISEEEERNYRLSRRSLLQCLTAAPVVGLQNYVRSYDLLLEPSKETYFSPYGVKSAPLRNIRLANALKHDKLLEDQKYTVLRIPTSRTSQDRASQKSRMLIALWTGATWLLFAGLLVAIYKTPGTTWVSYATCAAFTGWSIILRLVEYVNVIPAAVARSEVNDPDELDAVFIMGRSNSAFVLEGSREDVKEWTSCGLTYRPDPWGVPASVWQGFTRLCSLMVLLFIFSAVPNGSTVDQVAFILLNAVAQLNVLVGQRLNSRYVLSRFVRAEDSREKTRTHVYAKLIRRFCDAETENQWVDASGMLPKTDVWNAWKERVVNNVEDPKDLYRAISNDQKFMRKKSVRGKV